MQDKFARLDIALRYDRRKSPNNVRQNATVDMHMHVGLSDDAEGNSNSCHCGTLVFYT